MNTNLKGGGDSTILSKQTSKPPSNGKKSSSDSKGKELSLLNASKSRWNKEALRKKKLISRITAWMTLIKQQKAFSMACKNFDLYYLFALINLSNLAWKLQEKNEKIFKYRVKLRTKFKIYYKYVKTCQNKGSTIDIRKTRDINM